jgi:small subunit ribosomal protein S6
MPDSAPLYDLMLVLSASAEDDRRAKVLADAEAQISGAGGTVERNDDWHTRPLAYEIRHQREGEYHLLQFSGPPSLLENLSYNLRIDDAVLRHRIIKVLPGTPAPPETPPPVAATAPARDGGGSAAPSAPAEDIEE